MEAQDEFLFADGPAPEFHPPDPRGDFYREVATIWQLPLGQSVDISLCDHAFADLHGVLDLAQAPELPFNRRQPVALRIGSIEFSSRQIVGWSLR